MRDGNPTRCSIEDQSRFKKRFARRVSTEPTESGCILWTGYILENGYGQVWVGSADKGMISAHRAAWILAHGEIPDGMCVLHKCDVRSCVNVEHLFLGTKKSNSADMVSKNRQSKGEFRYNSKLKEVDVIEARERFQKYGSAEKRRFAKEKGVSRATVDDAVSMRTWKHVK